MKSRRIAALALAWAFTALSFLGAQASEVVPVPLEWQEVEGAGGYKVEVKNAAQKTIFSQNVTQPKVVANLLPGAYQIQISSLNRFGKVEASTPWTPLTVKKIPTPEVTGFAPQAIEEDESFTLEVVATGIDDKTKWELVRSDAKAPGLEPQTITLSETGATLEFAALPRGTYSLRATGKTGKKGTAAKSFVVGPHHPILTALVPQRVDPSTPFSLKVSGRYLDTRDTVLLTSSTGTKTVARVVSKAFDGGLTLAVGALTPDEYTVTLTSALGVEAQESLGLTVLLPAPVFDSLVTLPVEPGALFQPVALAVSHITPEMRLFLVVADQRVPVSIRDQTEGRVTVDFPRNLEPGEYDFVLVNSQGKETQVRQGLTIKEGGAVRATFGSLKVMGNLKGCSASVDGGESFELPHVFEEIEAGKHLVVYSIEELDRRFFEVPDHQIEVLPHKALDLVGWYKPGQARLFVKDLPSGYFLKLDGHLVDAKTIGDEGKLLDAGRYTLEAISPAGQTWLSSVTAYMEMDEIQSFRYFLPVVPTRTIHMAGTTREWNGLVPLMTDVRGDHRTSGPGSDITAVWLAQDERNLYIRFDFGNGSPSRRDGADYTIEFRDGRDSINLNTYYGKRKDGMEYHTDLWSNNRQYSESAGANRSMPLGLEVSVTWSELARFGVNKDNPTSLKGYFNVWGPKGSNSWDKTFDEATPSSRIWLSKPKLTVSSTTSLVATAEEIAATRVKIAELELQREALVPQYKVRNDWDSWGWNSLWLGLASSAVTGFGAYRVLTDFEELKNTSDPARYSTLITSVELYRPVALAGAGMTLAATTLGAIFFNTGTERWDLDNQAETIDQQLTMLQNFY